MLPLAPAGKGPVSAATLLHKAKQFDDGLYATVELAAQQGLGPFSGKSWLLRSLAATLAGSATSVTSEAAAIVYSACQLSGLSVERPEAISCCSGAKVADFLGDEKSKPMGFYTWNAALAAIFRQDRFLQQPLDPGPADDLARAVEQTPGAADALSACLRLNARLTNPAKPLGLQDAGKRPPFLPPSRSHEVSLFEGLYENSPVPEGFDLDDGTDSPGALGRNRPETQAGFWLV